MGKDGERERGRKARGRRKVFFLLVVVKERKFERRKKKCFSDMKDEKSLIFEN